MQSTNPASNSPPELIGRSIAEWYFSCITGLKKTFELMIRSYDKYSYLMQHAQTAGDNMQKAMQLLRGEVGRFKVWGENCGAHRKKTSRVSLDYKLRDASRVFKRVIELLAEMDALLQETLEEVEESFRTFRDNVEGKGKGRGENFTPLDIGEFEGLTLATDIDVSVVIILIEDISHIITCLYHFSIAIRNPVPHDRSKKYKAIDTSHYAPFDFQHALEKFPKAPTYLIERLAKANTQRRKYFLYREQHHEKIVGSVSVDEPTAFRTPISKPTPMTHDGPGHEQMMVNDVVPTFKQHDIDETVSQADHSVKTYTTLSTVPQNVPVHTQLEADSREVESEAASVTSYALSLATGATGLQLTPRLDVPPPPGSEDHFEGLPFQCPYCYTFITMKSTRAWMKHVFVDLRPYVCTFSDCSTPDHLFESRHEWFNHEMQYHRRQWECAECEKVFGSSAQFLHHIQDSHARLFMDEQQLDYVLLRCERPIQPNETQQCLICGLEYSQKRLRSHIADHLQQLALFTLPRRDKEKDRAEDNSRLSEDVSTFGRSTVQGSDLEFDSNPSRNSIKSERSSADGPGTANPKPEPDVHSLSTEPKHIEEERHIPSLEYLKHLMEKEGVVSTRISVFFNGYKMAGLERANKWGTEQFGEVAVCSNALSVTVIEEEVSKLRGKITDEKQAWACSFLERRVCRAMAELAVGTVFLIKPTDWEPPEDSVWLTWEYPALTRNKKVTRIAWIDPDRDPVTTDKLGQGQTIWRKGQGESVTEPHDHLVYDPEHVPRALRLFGTTGKATSPVTSSPLTSSHSRVTSSPVTSSQVTSSPVTSSQVTSSRVFESHR